MKLFSELAAGALVGAVIFGLIALAMYLTGCGGAAFEEQLFDNAPQAVEGGLPDASPLLDSAPDWPSTIGYESGPRVPIDASIEPTDADSDSDVDAQCDCYCIAHTIGSTYCDSGALFARCVDTEGGPVVTCVPLPEGD